MATGYDVDQLLEEGRSRWLTNAELLFILENHDSKMIRESVPQLPPSGSLFLYNKNITPSFRRDGHKWRKKPSGRVSESHEPLKVHGVEVIECYYATREDSHDFKRRSYWMLNEAKKHIVLVHYRDTTEREAAKRTKVDEYGFILDKTPGVYGAGLFECKRQKRDASPQGKAKLVDVSANEEELDFPFLSFLMDKDNVDPFQLLLQAPSPEYHEHWSLIEQNNYNMPL